MGNRKRIAYYGERGSYSEQAAMQHFGKVGKLTGFRFLPEVFEAVRMDADYGVVPIENSTEGPVTQTYDLLLESDLKIFGEEIVRIEHCLIAKPGTQIRDIKNVYSHPQALGQCRGYLEKHKFNAIPYYDTAGSVKMIRDSALHDSAAIASRSAARLYKMKVLAKAIQSNKSNFTRFMIISKEGSIGKCDKTSIAFGLKNRPGSLFNVLKCFADNGVNIIHIESRPISGKPWQYNFYLDCEGSAEDAMIRKATSSLRNETIFLKILGSYKSA